MDPGRYANGSSFQGARCPGGDCRLAGVRFVPKDVALRERVGASTHLRRRRGGLARGVVQLSCRSHGLGPRHRSRSALGFGDALHVQHRTRSHAAVVATCSGALAAATEGNRWRPPS